MKHLRFRRLRRGRGSGWRPQRWQLWLLAVSSTVDFLAWLYPGSAAGVGANAGQMTPPGSLAIATSATPAGAIVQRGSLGLITTLVLMIAPIVVLFGLSFFLSTRRHVVDVTQLSACPDGEGSLSDTARVAVASEHEGPLAGERLEGFFKPGNGVFVE